MKLYRPLPLPHSELPDSNIHTPVNGLCAKRQATGIRVSQRQHITDFQPRAFANRKRHSVENCIKRNGRRLYAIAQGFRTLRARLGLTISGLTHIVSRMGLQIVDVEKALYDRCLSVKGEGQIDLQITTCGREPAGRCRGVGLWIVAREHIMAGQPVCQSATVGCSLSSLRNSGEASSRLDGS